MGVGGYKQCEFIAFLFCFSNAKKTCLGCLDFWTRMRENVCELAENEQPL